MNEYCNEGVHMRWFIGCMLLLLLSACQVFNRPDTVATLRAENTGYVIEATTIIETAQAEGTQVQSTANAAITVIAETNSLNAQLVGTLRAVIPPTPSRGGNTIVGTAAPDGLQFVDTRTASSVRESDGCAIDSKAQFSTSDQRIYATTRALNIRAGTQMGVQWGYQGQVAWSESFTVSADDDDFCIWFYIDPATIPFTPGNWTVRLTANGAPVEPEMIFTIEDVGAGGG